MCLRGSSVWWRITAPWAVTDGTEPDSAHCLDVGAGRRISRTSRSCGRQTLLTNPTLWHPGERSKIPGREACTAPRGIDRWLPSRRGHGAARSLGAVTQRAEVAHQHVRTLGERTDCRPDRAAGFTRVVQAFAVLFRSGVPYGIRTRVTNVKGWGPGPLDERDSAALRSEGLSPGQVARKSLEQDSPSGKRRRAT